jgi:hypothetical protein
MARLARVDDIPAIHDILSHPDVATHIGEGLDATITPPSILTFVEQGRVIFFVPKSEGVWEFHTAFIPEARGRDGLKMAKACADAMFRTYGANVLSTYTTEDNPHARPPRTMGFRPSPLRDDQPGITRYSLTRKKWRQLCQQQPL